MIEDFFEVVLIVGLWLYFVGFFEVILILVFVCFVENGFFVLVYVGLINDF